MPREPAPLADAPAPRSAARPGMRTAGRVRSTIWQNFASTLAVDALVMGLLQKPMNDTDNRALWDRKYEEGLPSLTKPDPYFVSAYDGIVNELFPEAGRALDLAAGLGRHALWLAERAWKVSAVDVSEVALEKLGQAAGELKINISLLAIDAAEYTLNRQRSI